jgi:hypothetical protein
LLDESLRVFRADLDDEFARLPRSSEPRQQAYDLKELYTSNHGERFRVRNNPLGREEFRDVSVAEIYVLLATSHPEWNPRTGQPHTA